MLRNIIMTLPALAFALPIITATPAANADTPRFYGEQSKPTLPSPQEEGGYVNVQIGLALCVMAQVLAEDRACEMVDTDKGLARCEVRGGKQVTPPTQKPKPEPDQGGLIFVSIEECTALGINVTVKN